MRFSIIIPTYNRRITAGVAIASVMRQTYANYELIVVDDGSTDGTSEWIRDEHPHIELVRLEVNMGPSAARNAAMRIASGNVIAFLDNDDLWHPTYLEQQFTALNASPSATFGYTLCSVPRGRGIVTVPSEPLYPSDLTKSLLFGNFIKSMSQVVIPRWALVSAGMYLDERLRISHDRELYLRLLAYGSPVRVDVPLVLKTPSRDSLSGSQRGHAWAEDGILLVDIFLDRPEGLAYRPWRAEAVLAFRRRWEGIHKRPFPQVKTSLRRRGEA